MTNRIQINDLGLAKHRFANSVSDEKGKLSMTPDQQWHWGEGNKYAMEGMKAMLLLNGGGALALLTFFGNRGKMLTVVSADAIDRSLISFSVGTIGCALVFVMAYFTQLEYGKSGLEGSARWWHYLTYNFLLAALLGFILGIWFARQAVVSALT
jgi:hypothetical protein